MPAHAELKEPTPVKRHAKPRGYRAAAASNLQVREQLDLIGSNGSGNASGFRDPAFADNKTQPVHRWVPWIAGFSSQFVRDCFDLFLKKNERKTPCVLDPFAGVGTTLVEAIRCGYKAVGFEINPYAALACRVKLDCPTFDVKALQTCSSRYRDVSAKPNGAAKSCIPPEFISRIPFFSPNVEKQVLSFFDFVKSIRNPEIADVFRLAFGSVMVSFSNYTYEPSLGSRPGAGKPLIENAGVPAVILAKLSEIIGDIRLFKEEFARRSDLGEGHVYNMDFLHSASVLHPGSVDLMVTSPPYMNNYHYIRNTRPQLFWLSLVSSTADLKDLEMANLGKYWQTVRTAAPIKLNFQHRGLSDALDDIRKTRTDKGPYGGPGWANYVTSYFNDSHRFLARLKRVLARDGIGVIVIGNSIIQGHEIKTDQVLGDLAQQVGLQLEDIHCVRTKRIGASITQSTVRRGDTNKASLYESAVIVRKK